ncbi:hypothetical protein IVIADoCa2_32 [Xanthomonas phage vB_Xar_IVIA-DoCa2]|uniref:Uncharacterized protein n=2 Tax=Pradovirus TaxID=1985733 RepID=A0A9X9JR25_9CAUD|nr:hypothetical protein IVIADoCa2_32 [Xanthomonas phage vB_Xar_IVIA-DoCa2]UYA98966.1 hypothetical protein IVIADoCa9_30 [Xanthomonas phage vB_Xar_IVIA-DoCa9]
MSSNIRIDITHQELTRSIGISITIPFDDYARQLFPNEHLREVVNEAMARVLDEAHNRR